MSKQNSNKRSSSSDPDGKSRVQKLLNETSKVKVDNQVGQRRMDMLRGHLNPSSNATPENKANSRSSAGKTNAKASEPVVFPVGDLAEYISCFSAKEDKARLRVVQAMKERPDLFHPFDIDLSRIEQLDLNYERVSICESHTYLSS